MSESFRCAIILIIHWCSQTCAIVLVIISIVRSIGCYTFRLSLSVTYEISSKHEQWNEINLSLWIKQIVLFEIPILPAITDTEEYQRVHRLKCNYNDNRNEDIGQITTVKEVVWTI